MRIRGRRWVAVLALCAAGAALAVKQGGSLYVKARNTRLMSTPSPTADAVAILQPGQQVTWLGVDPKNKQWHRVEASGKQGLVFQSNLSSQPPQLELVAQNGVRQVDPVAFSSSGAAVKLLGDGVINYGKAKGTDYGQAATQLRQLGTLAREIPLQEVSERARKAQLHPVVGPQNGGTP
ncbi:SH3 domain-containing protein [Hyalangium rubrum]|uniref:SH3 domain-containing protein n=1 Tax=Hyalangium rubrum TaxID=3103134 RepID=A0ABU5GZF1_9BACT|nr:SH3 domain-containing protein [Hyalangium sp. s54d21]MDY7225912.1 SH3 domain-containing protein [Hyalangium sp. s54d21]